MENQSIVMEELLDKEFSPRARNLNIEQLKSKTFDLLVIGGGITGAGTACVASNRGIKTALVEMNDFASGTSSKSSKLLHGGVRYLEQYRFKLVFESLRDRNDLFKTLPHIAKPLSFVVPIYKNYKETVLLMNLGLTLYDFLSYISGNMITKLHKFLTNNGVKNFENNIRKQDLKGGIQYFDGNCDDARLTVENIKTAHQMGVTIANYVKIISFEKDNSGKVSAAIAKDLISGESFKINARKILNASGPWVDAVNKADNTKYENKLKPTKGVHIIIPKVTDGNALLLKTPTPPVRWVFIIPYQEYSIIGTTDTEAKTSEDDYSYLEEDNYAEQDEIKYLLETVNYYYPEAKVTEKDIVSSFGGWRPLIAPPKDVSESEISREHEIFETDSGIISIAGGKLTGYVSMSEEIVDYLTKKHYLLPKKDAIKKYPQPLSWNTDKPLDDYIAQETAKDPAETKIITRLINKYGTEYYKIYQIMQSSPELREEIKNLSKDAECYLAEVLYSVFYEMSVTVKDFMMRRHRIILQDENQGIKAVDEISELMSYTLANLLNWDESYRKEWNALQKKDYLDEVEKVNSGLTIKKSLTGEIK